MAGVRDFVLLTFENRYGLKLFPCVGASGCISQAADKFVKANKHYRLITHDKEPSTIRSLRIQNFTFYSQVKRQVWQVAGGYGDTV